MHWFGPQWFGPICETNPRVEHPLGRPCTWCSELIEPHDAGLLQPGEGPGEFPIAVFHVECLLRQVVGGINHLRGNCTCCGGTEPPDPPGFTRREAARMAAEYGRRR